jgi:alanine racemase
MAVIKANGYGHGLFKVADALSAADGFALLNIQDAVTLREQGFRQVILLLEGAFSAEDMARAAQYDLTLVIHNTQQLTLLDAYPGIKTLDVWLKINSGMNRLGFIPELATVAMEQLHRHRAVRSVTLMTHFANADEARGVADPLCSFNDFAAAYRVPRSLANSAALLRFPAAHGSWVRPGIMLYGASPLPNVSARDLGLRPAMSLKSRIIAVQELRSEDEVGYGSLFRADQSMRIGIVACGYADGYPRHALGGTPILVDGIRTQTLGRVSMDMLFVDLRPLPNADVGSSVTLWGEGMPIEEVARSAETIAYELLCAITARVPVVT